MEQAGPGRGLPEDSERGGQYDFTCRGGSGGRGGRSQIDLHFGCAHPAQEVPVIGGYHPLAVGENTAGPAAAETAAGMGNSSASR